MGEPRLGTDLERRTAGRVREIPEALVPLFCVSRAERFLEGFETWIGEEEDLPEAGPIRRAVEVCWAGQPEPAEVMELLRRLQEDWSGDEQPLFASPLSLYVVEVSLVEAALSSRLRPEIDNALRASVHALDFHLQLADLRREVAGVGPAWDDPGRDLREFESDPGALAEAESQVLDAEQLRAGAFDVRQVRDRSAAQGRRVLDEVLALVHP